MHSESKFIRASFLTEFQLLRTAPCGITQIKHHKEEGNVLCQISFDLQFQSHPSARNKIVVRVHIQHKVTDNCRSVDYATTSTATGIWIPLDNHITIIRRAIIFYKANCYQMFRNKHL